MAADLNKIKLEKESLEKNDFGIIESLNKEIDSLVEELQQKKIDHSRYLERHAKLNVPLSNGSKCEHCRQDLTEEYLQSCQEEINREIESLSQVITDSVQEQKKLNLQIIEKKETAKQLNEKLNQLEKIKNSFSTKEEQIKDKKKYYTEYNQVIEEYQQQIKVKDLEIQQLKEKIHCKPFIRF